MLRKLPLATAVALALMPFQSHALGLGNISTNSVLNEEFDAEIELLSVPPGELDGVKASLASPDAFERLGIDRPYVLSSLKFETDRKPNGQAVIKVSSQQLIQEPFLNFLVEVNWPKGRMVREFTVLLDPPLTTRKKARPVSAPKTASVSSSPAASSSTTSVMPSRAMQAGSGEYGPVQRNETLWTIAERYSGGDVSVYQMMQAILQANPQAFSQNNINTLKAGTILRIPTREEATSMSRAEARALSDQHYQEWKNGFAPAPAAEPAPVEAPEPVAEEPAPAPEKPAAEADADSMAKPAEAEQPVSEEEAAHLKLSGTDAEGAEGTGADTDSGAMRDELITAQEKIVSSQGEVQDMMGRMSLMERQLDDMKRLLELKDEQLTQLQEANQDLTQQVEQAAQQPEPVAEAEVKPVEKAEVKPAEPAPAPVATKPAAPQTEMDKVKSVVDMVLGSAVLTGIVIAVFVVLLALIWAAFSRRKPSDDDAVAIAPAPKAAPAAKAAVATAAGGAAAAAAAGNEEEEVEETSFLREFESGEMEGFKDMETGESDPLAEADVYIAYGRYDQAEKMISDALSASPGNRPLQNKLLEIHYANKDADKFNSLAADMHNSGAEAEDPDGWNRIKLMGADIDAENALYADAMDAPSVDMNDSLDLNDAINELESQMSQDPGLSSMLPDADNDAEVALDSDIDEQEIAAVADDDLGFDLELETDANEDVLSLPEEEPLASDIPELVEQDTSLDDLAAELESFNIDAAQDDTQSVGSLDDIQLSDEFALDDEFADLSSELAEMDDVATKLDLAKAYIEMGDVEGARGILEEVVNEGDTAQQQEARDLISGMS